MEFVRFSKCFASTLAVAGNMRQSDPTVKPTSEVPEPQAPGTTQASIATEDPMAKSINPAKAKGSLVSSGLSDGMVNYGACRSS